MKRDDKTSLVCLEITLHWTNLQFVDQVCKSGNALERFAYPKILMLLKVNTLCTWDESYDWTNKDGPRKLSVVSAGS